MDFTRNVCDDAGFIGIGSIAVSDVDWVVRLVGAVERMNLSNHVGM